MSFKFRTFYPSLKKYAMFSPQYSHLRRRIYKFFHYYKIVKKGIRARAHSYDAITIFIIYSLAEIHRIRFLRHEYVVQGDFVFSKQTINNRWKSIYFYFIIYLISIGIYIILLNNHSRQLDIIYCMCNEEFYVYICI